MAFKDTRLWKAREWVKNWFYQRDDDTKATSTTTPISTTPTVWSNTASIVNSNIQWTTLVSPTNTNTLNETIEKQRQEREWWVDEITNSETLQSNYFDIESVDKTKLNNAIGEKEKQSKEHWRETFWRKANEFANFVWDIYKSQTYDTDYQSKEDKTYVGYNKDNWDMYELVLNTDWVINAQERFNNAYNDFITKINELGWDNISDETFNNLYEDFYNQVSWLFKVEADDWYSDWFFFNTKDSTILWRRKNSFSDEQLDSLAQNWITSASAYVPTKEQLSLYIQWQGNNTQLQQDLLNKYDIKDDPLDLSSWIKWRAQEMFIWRATNWLLDLAKENLQWSAVQNYVLNASEIITKEFDRAWTYAEPAWEEAELIKQLAQREWRELTDSEQEAVELAAKLNSMLQALADSLNKYFKENWRDWWVDENWQITEARDVFSDWSDLWTTISKWVIDASWLDMGRNESWLDAFQELSNKTRYLLNKDTWWIKWAWTKFDRALGNVWYFLSEAWQQTIWSLMKVWNIYGDLVSWNIREGYSWNRLSKTSEFMNQDFTAWMLITTKETWLLADAFGQTWSRTIRKYLLQAWEYTPEFIGNIIPDILLYSTWIWEVWAFTTIANKAKNIKAITKAWDFAKTISWLKKWKSFVEWVKETSNLLSKTTDAPDWMRVWAQWLDKGITNWIIDQAIDAQYSPYDSESYSDTSELLSLWWTVLFESIPWLWKSWAFKMVSNKLVWRDVLEWTAWNPLLFFSKEENKDTINQIAKTSFNKSPSWMTFDDFRKLSNSFEEMNSVLKDAYNKLPDDMKTWANKRTKENAWNMLSQVYNVNSNSIIGRNIRAIITNDNTNIADLAKYLWNIFWDV